MRIKGVHAVAFAILTMPGLALAGDPPVVNGPDTDNDGADEDMPQHPNTEVPPPPTSDNDPTPVVAPVGPPKGDVIEQAGVGGATAYGRPGVLELGGAAGFTANSDFTQINVTPSIGWFLTDNLELSGHFGAAYVEANDESSSLFSLLVEPSYHLPFNQRTFGFFGLGVGAAYLDGPGAGFAMAPRLGANFLVGRSGILTPAIAWQYTTHDTMETPQGTLLAVSSAVAANIGYTVMW